MNKQRYLFLLVLLVALLLGSGKLLAGPLATPGISRWVVGSGGGTLAGGSFSVSSTTGQAEAGEDLNGGSYRLTSGFWGEASASTPPATSTLTFLPMVQR